MTPNIGFHHSPAARAKIAAARKGRKHTPETRAKISALKSGRKNPCWDKSPSLETRAKISAALQGRRCSSEVRAKISASKCGPKHPMWGKHHTPETKAGISAARKGRKHSQEARAKISIARRGSGNGHWLGGISRLPYAWTFNDELKEEVRRRDGYKCQLCGVPQAECKKKLPVHHIDYSKGNSDPVNLVTLCHSCHARTNENRKQWMALFHYKALEDLLKSLGE